MTAASIQTFLRRQEMDLNRVKQLLAEVPDYDVFLTVDELNRSGKALAEKYPQSVDWIEIGQSRAGDKIHALKIGNGTKKALMFAMPHPNEPIGSMMLEFLSEKLASDDVLREELDYTWYLIKCIDVDGTRLNEGWFKGPFSVTNYARNYYRPPSFQQVEWTFPVEYKTLKFDSPMPETQALMKIIQEVKPDFMFSLHNAGFGGVYLYLSGDLQDFYPDFYDLVKSQELPLHLGEPEVPYAVKFADAVFGMLGVESSYDFMEKNSDKDPAEILQGGAGSFEYACRYADPLFLVCEMPYFYHPDIHNTEKTEDIRRELVLQGLEARKQRIAFLKEQYDQIETYLTLDTAFKETTESTIKNYEERLAAQEHWAKEDPSLEEKATVAEKFDNLLGSRFYQLLGMGTAVRMVEAQIEVSGQLEPLMKAHQALLEYFEKEAAALENSLDYDVIPIRKLVSVQLGCALLLADRAG
jgi:hypothetical protein